MRCARFVRTAAVCAVAFLSLMARPGADTSVQSLPFTQDWSNTSLISADDNWSGVPGIVGYRGDLMASGTGSNPQLVVIDFASAPVVDVNANRSDPNTFTTGGVAEFDGIPNPTIALQGSGTAKAPNVVITVSTAGQSNVHVSYNLRDIDGSADNAVQPVALQYRVGTSGNYTNVPAGFVADASTGPSLANLVTPVSVDLPPAAANQPVVQIRIITTDAVGSDEWIGIDDIQITGTATGTDTAPAVMGTTPANAATNVAVDSNIAITFSESVNANGNAFALECPAGSPQTFTQSSSPATTFTLTPASPLPYSTICTVTVTAGLITDTDTNDPPDEMSANFAVSFTTAEAPPVPSNSTVVISQVYGGGGNSGALYKNDFVELYNRSASTVDIGGWSLQYTSASGNTWDSNRQPLGGTIAPGQYLLVALASGGTTGATLPAANIIGQINMSATTGKVALVDSFDALAGNCPVGDPHVMDFVGYGSSADCQEGSTRAPAPSNTTALFRGNGGSTDTDRNGSDFATGAPNPRRTAPIVELGPAVFGSDPRANGVNAPRDATIAVTFTEPVDVFDPWFDISCATSGPHNSATFAGDAQTRYITPNVNFVAGEKCTVTILKNQVADQDLDDSAPDTNNLKADYVWSFTVATGTAPPEPSSVHLTMGNPTGAVASLDQPDNYLMEKPEYALSYNRDFGRPNWVSWHLSDEWIGSLTRVDSFRPDPAVPPDWYRVQSFDFSGTGFDRGHMTPNADRDKETSIPINQATFLMSNMVAQAPDNNQGPWASFENYLRSLMPADELYIVAGPAGIGGSGSSGGTTVTVAHEHVTVPAYTWKVALVLPKDGGNDISRVSCSTRTIAVILPNTQGIRSDPWENYLTTVDAVETMTGYDLFSNLPEPIQQCVEAGTNGNNPPLVKGDQAITFTAPGDRTYGDPVFTVSATGGKSGNPVTFAATGACTSGGFSGSTITITAAGACTITASQAGSDLYNAAADVAQTLAVHKATPAFSALDAPAIEAGSATVAIAGTLGAGALVPTGIVAVSVGGNTANAAVGADGRFTATLPTGALAAANTPYTIGFSYAGDPNFGTATGSSTLTVTDTTSPVIVDVTPSLDTLGTPNHKMIDVTVDYTATDFSGATCELTVASNEPVNGTGDGNTGVDWQVLDPHHVQLRAERAGTGMDRIYTLTVTCVDPSNNRSTGTTTVSVPH